MREVALHEAVRDGWDAEAVGAALLGSQEPTLWRRASTARGHRAVTGIAAALMP